MVGQAHYRQAAIAGIIGRLVVNCSDQDQGPVCGVWDINMLLVSAGRNGAFNDYIHSKYAWHWVTDMANIIMVQEYWRLGSRLHQHHWSFSSSYPPVSEGGGLIDNCLLVIIRDTDCLPHQQSTLFNHQPLCLWVIKIPAGISSPSSVQIWINFSHWIMQPVFVWKFVCNLWPSITIMSPLSAVTQHSHQQK